MNQLAHMGGDSSLQLSMFCDPTRYSLGLLLPKNSPFTKTFNLGVVRAAESGDLLRLRREWFRTVVGRQRHLVYRIPVNNVEDFCISAVF